MNGESEFYSRVGRGSGGPWDGRQDTLDQVGETLAAQEPNEKNHRRRRTARADVGPKGSRWSRQHVAR